MSNYNFHLGITCAGGGTGGAYIGGVLDYLFEVLSKWEEGKEKGKEVPQYRTIIETMGGNSAGSISVALAVLSWYKKYEAVRGPSKEFTGNLLYDAWVLLNKVGEGDILEALLTTSDIENSERFVSLLNSKAIDEVSQLSIANGKVEQELPAFVSKNFEFLISLANLRGIPFEIKFGKESEPERFVPGHQIMQHKLIAHFKPSEEKEETDGAICFSPKEPKDLDLLFKCAKSSASLPFIFKPRYFEEKEFPEGYIDYAANEFTLHGMAQKMEMKNTANKITGSGYHFHTVDGGTFNNEPFGEVVHRLNHLIPEVVEEDKRLFMIDPYPTFHEKEKTPVEGEAIGVLDLVKSLYTALRGQGLFKSRELLADHDIEGEGFIQKGLIFPSLNLFQASDNIPLNYLLASEPVVGLAGFLSEDFRNRDFFLGRYNCQVFLRRFLTIDSKDTEHPIHKEYQRITDNGMTLRERYGLAENDPLPIIPDFNFFDQSYEWIELKGKKFEIPNTKARQTFIAAAKKCEISETQIESYRASLQNRLQKILKPLMKEAMGLIYPLVGKSVMRLFQKIKWYHFILIPLALIFFLLFLIPALPLLFVGYLLFKISGNSLRSNIAEQLTAFAIKQIKLELNQQKMLKSRE